MTDEPMTQAELLQALGPVAYVEAHAIAFDTLFPDCGLGDLLRDYYRIACHAAAMTVIATAGARDELDYYLGGVA